MSKLLMYAGTGRNLGLPLAMESDIKAVQIGYKIKTKNQTFIFGLVKVIRELVKHITDQDLQDDYLPSSRRTAFSGENWQEIIDLMGGAIPINVYMVDEGSFLNDDEYGLVIETTDERFAWIAHHLDSVIEPHFKRIVEMGEKILKLRVAVRQAVTKYSDREATDLCKLFLLPPENGVSVDDMELFSAMFKVASPLESSPISVKYISDNYSPANLHASAVMSADIESPIGASIEERLGTLLSKTRDRHLNLYIKPESDNEASQAMTRFKDILNDRNTPLVICLESGDKGPRTAFWMKNLDDLVGMEQNSKGLLYPQKQFGVCVKVEDDEELTGFCDGAGGAGYTIDGFSFMLHADLNGLSTSATIEKVVSYKTDDWDDNHISHDLPQLHKVGTTPTGTSLNSVVTSVIDQVETAYPHDFKEHDPYPGRYSGWWVKRVVTGKGDR